MGFYVNRIGTLEYLTADALEGTAHCFSTRYGGVSKGILSSLNLGVHRGDQPENVLENYRILGDAVGFKPEDTVFTRQVHSDIIDRVGKRDCGRRLQFPVDHECDGLITDEPNVVLTVFSADCTPVLLYDPVCRAIGAVHAGWRGTAAQIAVKAARRMCAEFGCKAENIRAAIGPCIGPCCFETDADVPEAMLAAFGDGADQVLKEKEDERTERHCAAQRWRDADRHCGGMYRLRTGSLLVASAGRRTARLARCNDHAQRR